MPADLDLARRAVACSGWRWMVGMTVYLWGVAKDTHMATICAAEPDYSTDPPGPSVPIAWDLDGRLRGPMAAVGDWEHDAWDYPDALPRLDDPATLGCLLALVREANSNGGICTSFAMSRQKRGEEPVPWWFVENCDEILTDGPTEAAALVAALEAAPGVLP